MAKSRNTSAQWSTSPARAEPIASSSTSEKPDTVLSILQNACAALDVAKDLAPLLPVPFLAGLFSSAKFIVDAAGLVKQNKRSCAELAQRVAAITRDVRAAIRGKEEQVDESLRQALEQLNSDFDEIKTFIDGESKRKLVSRVFARGDVSARITELSTKVSDSMSTFQSTSSIRLELSVEQVKKTVVQIDERLTVMDERAHRERKWDGQYRVYRLADVDFGDKISHTDRVMYYSETRAIGNVPAIGSISIKEELWSATVKGKTVAVKTYRGPIEMFRANVDALRYLRHTNVVQVQGYSDDESSKIHMIVFKGHLRKLDDYLETILQQRDRYRLYVKGIMSTLSGRYYLCSQGLNWLGRNNDIMYNIRTGEIILGAQDEFVSHFPYGMDASQLDQEQGGFAARMAFLNSLPTLIQDWDMLRSSAAAVPSLYRPEYFAYNDTSVLEPAQFPLPPALSREAMIEFASSQRSLLSYIFDVLAARFASEPVWNETRRRTKCSSELPPLGSVCVLNPSNDFNKYEEVYTRPIGMLPGELHRFWSWSDHGETVMMPEPSKHKILRPLEEGKQYSCEIGHEVNGNLRRAMGYLIRNGAALACQLDVRLRDIGVMATVQQNCFYAYYRRDTDKSEENDQTDTSSALQHRHRDIYFHSRIDPLTNWLTEPVFGHFLESPIPPHPDEEPHAYATSINAERFFRLRDESAADTNVNLIRGRFMNVSVARIEGVMAYIWQTWRGRFLRLQPDNADVLEWMEKMLASPEGPRYQLLQD